MVAVRSPLIDLEMDEQTALYVGVLERQVLALTINDAKFRALLEALTGVAWDDLRTDFEQSELNKIAEENLMTRLGVSRGEAKRIIRVNKAKANERDIPPEDLEKELAAAAEKQEVD